ncbi:MAG TPA: hypothetical protein VN969_44660 [Streptosporangiaceae bacterium]|nr:hypothetical protein [Streptosporangiaceae bacterium]
MAVSLPADTLAQVSVCPRINDHHQGSDCLVLLAISSPLLNSSTLESGVPDAGLTIISAFSA